MSSENTDKKDTCRRIIHRHWKRSAQIIAKESENTYDCDVEMPIEISSLETQFLRFRLTGSLRIESFCTMAFCQSAEIPWLV